MERIRSHKVRLDTLSRKQFAAFLLSSVSIVVAACIVGAYGPASSVQSSPLTNNTSIDLLNSNCSYTPWGTKVSAVKPCWQPRKVALTDWFEFHRMWTQSFNWQVTLMRNQTAEPFSSAISFEVTWEGSDQYVKSARRDSNWDVITKRVMHRTVHCAANSAACDPILLFLTNVIDKKAYFFQLSLPNTTTTTSFITSAKFDFSFSNAEYTQYELGFRMAFCAFTLLIGVVYTFSVRNARMFSSRTPSTHFHGSSWITSLLVALFLFNQPWYFVQFVKPNPILIFVSTLCQLSFVSLLLLFWLCEFGLLASKDPVQSRKSWWTFFIPKALLCGSYFAVAVILYAWITFQQQLDPTFDWSVDSNVAHGVNVLGVVMASTYTLTLLYYAIRSSCRLCAKPADVNGSLSFRLMYITHIATVLITLGGIGFGVVYNIDVHKAFDYLFFNVVFNVYVYGVAFLYAPALDDVAPFERVDGRDRMKPRKSPHADGNVLITEDGDDVAIEFHSHSEMDGDRSFDAEAPLSPSSGKFGVGTDDDDDDDGSYHATKSSPNKPHAVKSPKLTALAGVLDLSLESPHRRTSGSPPTDLTFGHSPPSGHREQSLIENSSLLTTSTDGHLDTLVDTNPIVTTPPPLPESETADALRDPDADDLFGL